MRFKISFVGICLGMIPFLWGGSQANAQNNWETQPNQNNILKFNVTAAFQNEARLLFEKELDHKNSLEFGVGYVYPNRFLTDQFGTDQVGAIMLASGFATQFAYRRYFDKQYYSLPPAFRSYLSPVLSFRHAGYDNEWFVLPHPNPDFSECQLESRQFDQIGLRILFGFQKARGRFVVDFYSGLGIKASRTKFTLHALNEGGEICEIVPTTTFPEQTLIVWDPAVSVHAGIKIGFRFGPHKEYPRDIDTNQPDFDRNVPGSTPAKF